MLIGVHRSDARRGLDRLDDLVEKPKVTSTVAVDGLRQFEPHESEAVRCEADLDGLELQQASRQQPRRCDDRDRKRHLCHDQRAPPSPAGAGDSN